MATKQQQKQNRRGDRMQLFQSKKGFIGLWEDIFKGFIAGFICGVILLLLIVFEIIPFPVSLCG